MDCIDRVLLVDDDANLCGMIRDYLRANGFAVEVARNAALALSCTAPDVYGIMLLASSLPQPAVWEKLKMLRSYSNVSVILLIEREEEIDGGTRILADDYVMKPFNRRELLARIHAVQRRKYSQRSLNTLVQVDDVAVDRAARCVRCRGQILELTTSEFSLIETLARSAGQVVSRESLMESVLGRRFTAFDRSLDMLVSRLRRKLAAAGVAGRIKTIRCEGYQFATSPVRAMSLSSSR